MKNLVIVESPAKAKTIEKYLGKDFTVRSSYGHIRDLPKKGMGIDIEHDFEPHYEITPDKKKVVSELRKLAKESDTIWLATDEDREGEAIAWHLAEALKLDKDTTKRIVFHEITKPAIEQAVANPRTINMNLVDAQQARRILDRLVGFELSPILWKKIRTGLSAGRVQSVAVRLIVEREREIAAFEPEITFKVQGKLVLLDEAGQPVDEVAVKLPQTFASEAEAHQFLEAAAQGFFEVEKVEEKPAKRSPKPPFTTSTLQQEAAQKLGFSVKQTMTLAQRLYEAGKITYMRTDSVNLSELAIDQAKQVIASEFGPDYVQVRHYKSKSANAQEAHEAIRPTDLSRKVVSDDRNEQRLYELIRRRTLASQMADAKFLRTTAQIAVPNRAEKLQAKGEVVVFEGFMKAYDVPRGEEEGRLPPMQVEQKLKLGELAARQSFSRPPARYNEASLVRTLEELGIGRPSTYAPTIDTIQQRGYVVKEDREGVERSYRLLKVDESGQVAAESLVETIGAEKAKLFPTDIAGVVTDFLVKHFGEIMDYHFTAHVEEELDEIAAGELAWRKMLHEFYDRFHPKVEAAEHVSREEAGQVRHLGEDLKTGKPVMVKVGRYGAYMQLGDGGEDGEEKPIFASLAPGQKMDTLTLEDALELFKLPRVLGEMPEDFSVTAADGTEFKVEKGATLTAKRGPFGPYLEFGPKQYAPLKGYDPLAMTLEEAVDVVKAHLAAQADKIIRSFPGTTIKILKGRWGPYITDTETKKNAKIAKNEDPMALSQEECEKRLAEAPEPKKRGGRRKTTRKKS